MTGRQVSKPRSPATLAAWSKKITAARIWEKSTGPRTAGGKRRASQNATKAELRGMAFKWAMAYVAAVEDH